MTFQDFMKELAAPFNRAVDQPLLNAYSRVLKDLTPQMLEGILERALVNHTGNFMPTPAQLIQLAQPQLPSMEYLQNEAVRMVEKIVRMGTYESFTYEDRALCETVLDLGGRNHLCSLSEDEVGYLSKKIKIKYEWFLAKELSNPRDMRTREIGYLEGLNQQRGIRDTSKDVLIHDHRPVVYLQHMAQRMEENGLALEMMPLHIQQHLFAEPASNRLLTN